MTCFLSKRSEKHIYYHFMQPCRYMNKKYKVRKTMCFFPERASQNSLDAHNFPKIRKKIVNVTGNKPIAAILQSVSGIDFKSRTL
jgi:hypothetical protein